MTTCARTRRASECVFSMCACVCVELSGGEEEEDEAGSGGWEEEWNYVYFENSSSNPYLIRRIEELNKTANGNVEAKVVCLFRRRDISGNLNTLADSNASEYQPQSSYQLRTCLPALQCECRAKEVGGWR
ncbi:hypothetical protein PAMP_015380 [Pampus punctatissimus]